MPPEPVEARGLVKRFGETTAVAGISFTVSARQCFGFVGPNGAGKTTVMRMVSCASPPTDGVLEVLGMNVATSPRLIKARLGVVPQDLNLDTAVSVLENLAIYARYFDIPRKVALERSLKWLDFFKLSGRIDWRVNDLSGGMKRRLLIARGLLNEPDVLLLDEPTTGLDPQARHLIWDKLRQLKSEGVTLLLTTHYMDEAAQLCDRLVIMHQGRILVEGAPDQLVADRLPPRVLELRGATDETRVLAERLGPVVENLASQSDRLLLYTRDSDELLAKVRSAGLPFASTLSRDSSLEDLFLMLTGRSLVE